jgi:hypothetical protein
MDCYGWQAVKPASDDCMLLLECNTLGKMYSDRVLMIGRYGRVATCRPRSAEGYTEIYRMFYPRSNMYEVAWLSSAVLSSPIADIRAALNDRKCLRARGDIEEILRYLAMRFYFLWRKR